MSGAITIDPKPFAAAMSKMASVVKDRKTIPVLQCVRLAASGGQLEIRGSDLDVELSILLPVAGELDPICIDTKRLSGLAAIAKDRGEIRLSIEGTAATLTAGRSRFNLDTLPADQFPVLSQKELPSTFSVEGAGLARVMTALAIAIRHDESRPYLDGIHIEPGALTEPRRAGSLVAVATDGHKMFVRDLAADGLPADMTHIIIPSETCVGVARLFSDAAKVQVETGPNGAAFSTDDIRYFSKLVDGRYPDWRRLIPNKPATHSYDVTELVAACKAVSAAVRTDSKVGKAVRLTIGAEELELQTREAANPGFSGTDICRHEQLEDPESEVVGVNVDYLIQVLDNFDADTVQIGWGAGTSPIMITSAAGNDRRAVIMPTRV